MYKFPKIKCDYVKANFITYQRVSFYLYHDCSVCVSDTIVIHDDSSNVTFSSNAFMYCILYVMSDC